jgi:hypothetical protein
VAVASRVRPFHQQQHHDHGHLCLDAVPQALDHVNPGAGPGFHGVIAQRQLRLALEEGEDGGQPAVCSESSSP